jgi:hypothetical protein
MASELFIIKSGAYRSFSGFMVRQKIKVGAIADLPHASLTLSKITHKIALFVAAAMSQPQQNLT